MATVTKLLFDLRKNLVDTSSALASQGPKYISVCELPTGISFPKLVHELAEIPMLPDANIEVIDFMLDPVHGSSRQITPTGSN